jgi:LPPG:FO 2-phospho-L-lactate transferase
VKIVALAGGVGGAKLADGLARVLPLSQVRYSERGEESLSRGAEILRFAQGDGLNQSTLTIIVNTGDDFEWMGLRICPDLDTVMYTLVGIANPTTGWGIEGDAFEALGMLHQLGGETWFRIGDRDLATDLRRTQLLREGKRLTETMAMLCQSLGIHPNIRILPMTDATVATMVDTDEGTLAFQDYFVRRAWQPVIRRIHFQGIERARPSIEVKTALDDADLIVLCPSNPFVSIAPIISLSGVREQLREHRTVAASPIIGRQAVKGPAAKMFRELGQEPTALAVARRYADFLDGFVIDRADADQRADIESLHIRVLVTDTLMRDAADRSRLAREILGFASTNLSGNPADEI